MRRAAMFRRAGAVVLGVFLLGTGAGAARDDSGQQVSGAEAPAVPAPRPAEPPGVGRLSVGVVGSKPFVVGEPNGPGGLSVDVWRDAAARAKLDYQLELIATVEEGIDRTAKGELDVLVGPISITAERAGRVEFTHPYLRASLAILAPSEGSFWRRAGPFLSGAFLIGSLTLLAILFGVGTLFWITERKNNPDMFPPSPLRGIANGVWLALVTMTTVGYGDRVPVTTAGRVVAGVWMLVAMVTASSLTAGIATALTLSQLETGTISSADELEGLRIGVVRGTVGADFAREHGARAIELGSLEEAIAALESGRVAGVVHDRPQLRYFLRVNPEVELSLSETEYGAQAYGFALRPKSGLHQRLGVALLQAIESRRIEELSSEWLGK